MRSFLLGIPVALLLATSATTGTQPSAGTPVKTLKVTVLSTMLAGNRGGGIGEWGFAALLEADGLRLLIDTGERADTVLRNAAELGIDLSTVTDVVITHNHGDHTGGLIALKQEFAKKNPRALSRTHVAQGIFLSRLTAEGREANGLLPIKAAYEGLGGTFNSRKRGSTRRSAGSISSALATTNWTGQPASFSSSVSVTCSGRTAPASRRCSGSANLPV